MGESAEKAQMPTCPCPDDECLRPNGPDCQKPLTLEQRLALLNHVMTLGPHQMFPSTPPEPPPAADPTQADVGTEGER